MNILLTSLRLMVLFSRNSVGCLNSPYITYRKLADEKSDMRQAIYIFILSAGYFIFASLIRSGFRNPYLLTMKFNILLLGGFSGFALMLLFLTIIGKSFKIFPGLKKLIFLWSYTLLPTLTWFFFTSFMYLIIPPPRTLSFSGKLYSIFYVVFSLSLLLWKLILYYLTLRFGLKLDLQKISIATLILIPVIAGYSVLMYRLGVFRIPFI